MSPERPIRESDEYVRDGVARPLYMDDGSTLTADVLEQVGSIYGLGVHEVSQVVEYGDFRGPVAQMLLDQRCPMSAEFELKHAPKGAEKVISRLNATLDLEGDEEITLSDETRASTDVKKNLQNQIYPRTQTP